MKITFLGTTTLLFDDGADQILFDAHFTRPSIEKYVVGAYVETDTELCDRLIERHHIDRLRAIFVSHTHHDHVMDAPYVARKCGATVYGSSSAKNVALGGGVPEDKTVVFQHGDLSKGTALLLQSKSTIEGDQENTPEPLWFRGDSSL